MGDGSAERAFLLGPLRIDVDPLEVAGGVGELVDAFLRDLHPVAVAEVLADNPFEPRGTLNDAW